MSEVPRFEEKLQNVVGLYLNPPENAVVFSLMKTFHSDTLHNATWGTIEEWSISNDDARLSAPWFYQSLHRIENRIG